jgi:ankyrin repeat protein
MAQDLDRAGRSPLHYAALEGDHEQVGRLLADGENPNVADRAAGFTPLHFAARGRHAEVARALLGAGAEVDPRDHLGRTPLATALRSVERGSGEVITVLLEHGAYPDTADLHGVSPRDLTQSVDHWALRRYLTR